VGAFAIHLLGPPGVSAGGVRLTPPRGRKAWALLAYLVAERRPVPRERLAGLLFEDAADPLGALRWNLSELRRLLGGSASLGGASVALELPRRTFVDVRAVLSGEWEDAAAAPGLGRELLEGMAFPSSPSFETWLTNERRHLEAACQAVLAEAAEASLAAGAHGAAADHAARLVAIDPFDERGQELLIRAYAASGDARSAARQLESCRALLRRELGREPGPALLAAASAGPAPPRSVARADGVSTVSVRAAALAQLEAGEAAVRAGAIDSGLETLERAVAGVAACGDAAVEARATLALAQARFDTARSSEAEVATGLHRALALGERSGEAAVAARARLMLAYVEELAGRYDRAERWLRTAAVRGDARLAAEVGLALGRCAIDRGDHEAAVRILTRVVAGARERGDGDIEAWARNHLGRVALQRGAFDDAAAELRAAAGRAHALGLTSWLPLPLGLLGRALVAGGELTGARAALERGLALGTHVGDPCWQALNLTGLGLLAAAEGRPGPALDTLVAARRRSLSGPTTSAYMLAWVTEALCGVAVDAGRREAPRWIAGLEALAARTGMRDLLARAAAHRRALTRTQALPAAA
jgi:DNA-binding SARP family transcriptional activator/predicted negative regulator of RcsB-dependent stress response